MKWLSILALPLAMGVGIASVFVIDGGRSERSPTAQGVALSRSERLPFTAHEVARTLVRRWSGWRGGNPTATCRPSKDHSGYFDCTLTLAGRGKGQAATSSYDFTVPAKYP
jgi:hypothetical protein